MYKENGLYTIYNPELFPGLRMSLHKMNARASIFFQGNAIVTGCNDFKLVEDLWNIVESRTHPYLQKSAHEKMNPSQTHEEDPMSKVYSSDHLTHNYTAMNRQIERLMYCGDMKNEDSRMSDMSDE
eukprot:gene1049-1592_t